MKYYLFTNYYRIKYKVVIMMICYGTLCERSPTLDMAEFLMLYFTGHCKNIAKA